jgi:hypothetical protein
MLKFIIAASQVAVETETSLAVLPISNRRLGEDEHLVLCLAYIRIGESHMDLLNRMDKRATYLPLQL